MDTETVVAADSVAAEVVPPPPAQEEVKKEKKKKNSLKPNSVGTDDSDGGELQKLEEKANKAQEAFEREEKLRKELESLNSKLLAEKTALLESLSGEKGQLSEFQEKAAKLSAQKNDLDNQLRVSTKLFLFKSDCKSICGVQFRDVSQEKLYTCGVFDKFHFYFQTHLCHRVNRGGVY